jgi:predicted site-specific integrase-resolvase
MKLSDYAKQQGICYLTAYNWFKSNRIPNARQLDNGTILVDVIPQMSTNPSTVLYARVSSQLRKQEMEYQIKRITDFANARGLVINKIYKEVASGMNDKRKELVKMLESKPTTIIVENKDRLTRFGFNYLELLLKQQGCEIIVMHPDENDEQDLVKDMISVVTSFCCRLYGLRRTKNKVKKIKEALKSE